MRIFQFLILMTLMLNGCKKVENELCADETKYRIKDFAGIKVYTDINDGIKCATKRNLPIFVLFTGFGCVGDTSYEQFLFLKRDNRKLLAEEYVPVVLYVDDEKFLDEIDEKSVQVNKNEFVLNNIGNKNALLQIVEFGNNSQPLLAVLDQFGTQIMRPIGYCENSNEYNDFLKNGISIYNEIDSQE